MRAPIASQTVRAARAAPSKSLSAKAGIGGDGVARAVLESGKTAGQTREAQGGRDGAPRAGMARMRPSGRPRPISSSLHAGAEALEG